jgi:hypothetical protein
MIDSRIIRETSPRLSATQTNIDMVRSQGNECQQLVGPLHQCCAPVFGAARLTWAVGYEHGSAMLANDV